MLHQHNDPLRAMDEIHCAAHAFDHLARNHPVGYVSPRRDLHCSKNRCINLSATDHPERGGGVEERCTTTESHSLLPCVDQVWVLLPFLRIRTNSENAILG